MYIIDICLHMRVFVRTYVYKDKVIRVYDAQIVKVIEITPRRPVMLSYIARMEGLNKIVVLFTLRSDILGSIDSILLCYTSLCFQYEYI